MTHRATKQNTSWAWSTQESLQLSLLLVLASSLVFQTVKLSTESGTLLWSAFYGLASLALFWLLIERLSNLIGRHSTKQLPPSKADGDGSDESLGTLNELINARMKSDDKPKCISSFPWKVGNTGNSLKWALAWKKATHVDQEGTLYILPRTLEEVDGTVFFFDMYNREWAQTEFGDSAYANLTEIHCVQVPAENSWC